MRTIYLPTVFVSLLLLINAVVQAETSLAPAELEGAVLVNAEKTADLIVNTPNLLIIDSRKEIEYTKGHIQGAISLPDTEMTIEKLNKLAPDKAAPVLFYCDGERCLRSSRAATHAIEWGYSRVYWFRNGWNEWVDSGMPISR